MIRPALATLALLACAATASAQVKLEYKFPEGSKATQKTVVKLSQTLTIAGMDIETDAEQTIITSEAVGKKNADGTIPIVEKIESLRSVLELPGGVSVTVDSANPDAKPDNEQLAFLYDAVKAMAGSSYTVVVDDKGKAKFVEGAEALQNKLGDLNPQAAAMVKDQLDAEAIRKEFDQEHSDLPEVLARAGEPWERTETRSVGGGQTFTFRRKYEYAGTVEKGGKTLDKITVRSLDVTYGLDPNAPNPVKVTSSDLKVDSSEGTILFDRELGRAVGRTAKDRIVGEMKMTINGQDLDAKLDLTLDSSTTLENYTK